MSLGPNEPCPCHSGRKHKTCCGPVLEGQPATTPEALMRSRYTAYALGRADHILRTTHPSGPHWRLDREAWEADVADFSQDTLFEGLEIVEARAVDDRGIVTFRAQLRGPAGEATMVERSLFQRVDGWWLYHSGTQP